MRQPVPTTVPLHAYPGARASAGPPTYLLQPVQDIMQHTASTSSATVQAAPLGTTIILCRR